MQQAMGSHAGPVRLVSRWWRNWRASRASVNELEACGADEVAHLARDVGVGPSELRTIAAKWPDDAGLLSRRIAEIGLDARQITGATPQVMRDLQRVCAQCAEHGRCAGDLDRDGKDPEWREYCPNVQTLDALRSEERDKRLMRRRKWRAF
jgi:uncharacterized protein YjiS (DUF1127 family)